jgi:glycogen phosphorylase
VQPLLPRVAYFCMEFGLQVELPIYSGGLGVLAGDYLKSAGDLRVPFTALGILWSEGYTVQRIGADGYPWDDYPKTPRDGLEPMNAQVTVKIRGKDVPLQVWRRMQGAAPLYLLEPREEADRWITRRLYGGGAEERVAQEIVLGVGGVRLLRALGIDTDVYHFNEGHAVFAGLELMRERMEKGASFERAWREVRPHVVFTTHTPVPAGNEEHALELLSKMGADLGVFSPQELAAIGDDPFGMTVAGLRLSRLSNGVAQLHGETARAMWKDVPAASPIIAITNGVHPPTWQDGRIRQAYLDSTLWETHQVLKRELIQEVRSRTGIALLEDRLTIAFARRAASYKRSDLILRDAERIAPLLASRRLQLLFAGKAHPADVEGKRIIANLVTMARRYPQSVVFLENYDLGVARTLVRGADVWLNNPRRPMEASGTSGMKAAMNGVLNCSILDGWWPEACRHGVNGWKIGDPYEGPEQDDHDLHELMKVLFDEVIPTYYEHRDRWTQMMKSSIEASQWRFSSDRMLEDYYLKMYAHTTVEPALGSEAQSST